MRVCHGGRPTQTLRTLLEAQGAQKCPQTGMVLPASCDEAVPMGWRGNNELEDARAHDKLQTQRMRAARRRGNNMLANALHTPCRNPGLGTCTCGSRPPLPIALEKRQRTGVRPGQRSTGIHTAGMRRDPRTRGRPVWPEPCRPIGRSRGPSVVRARPSAGARGRALWDGGPSPDARLTFTDDVWETGGRRR